MYTLDELKQMIFIDIETATQKESFQEIIDENPELEQYWDLKTMQLVQKNKHRTMEWYNSGQSK